MKTNVERIAVGYCRVSTDKQREESIDHQKREIQKYADENNIKTSNQLYVFQREGFFANSSIYLDDSDKLNITSNSPREMSVFHSQQINLFNNWR